jgi:hypothetical protein
VAVVGAAAGTIGVGFVAFHGDAAPRSQPQSAVSADAALSATPASAATQAVVARQRSRSLDRSDSERASRGGNRPSLVSAQRATKTKALAVGQQHLSGAVTKTVVSTNPHDIARSMLAHYGWSADQFSCLDEIYIHESGWNPSASNPYSGAYGIPQALPGDKMAAFGSDWQTNPATQLAWGLTYIRDRYGSPCGAWAFWQSHNWY